MEWIKKRVWQLGIAVLLALAGAWIVYAAGTDGENQTTLWLGLGLFFIAMLVPLFTRLIEAAQEEEGEKGEN